MTQKSFLPGAFFLLFLAASAGMGIYSFGAAWAGVEAPSLTAALRGGWTPAFEKSFDAALPAGGGARFFWARAEYALFREGRRGVVIGNDGWLFTAEELTCPPRAARNRSENLASIGHARDVLARAGVKLAVVLVPSKARLAGARLPACREEVYAQVRAFLDSRDIPSTDLLSATAGDFYLRTDTHWRPEGARQAARRVSALVRSAFPGLALPVLNFTTHTGAARTHQGDLLRFVPGVSFAPEQVSVFTTEKAGGAGPSLLGEEDAPRAALVGTSYSADPVWNFEGFLKEALKADVLNAAVSARGPFAAMESYLAGEMWKAAPPRLVVWEIPERYFLLPDIL